jgi:hypothetical protein
MKKGNAVMVVAAAVAMAAVLLASMLATAPQLASADPGQKEKKENRPAAVFNFIKERRDRDGGDYDGGGWSNAGVLAAQNISIKAKGVAVTKSEGGYAMSDAVLSLSGDVQKRDGNHARTVLGGTIDVGSQRYQIQAEGKLKIDGKFGTLQVSSKTGDGRLQINGIVIPVQNDGRAWKFVADTGKVGGKTRIYGMMGDVQLSGSGGGGTAPSSESKLTVRALDAAAAGNAVSGLYVNLAKEGATVAAGYTPFAFTVKSNAAYTVTVSDYQDKVFDHWDNGSTNRSRTVSLSADTTITAYYRTGSPQGLSLTVNAAGPDGSVRHMWTVIQYGSTGVQAGYTPLSYSGTAGATYDVSVSDYQDLVFDRWDNGSTARTRQVTLSSASTTITAYFKQSPQSSELDHFAITRIGNNQTAGSEFTFAVTAVDGLGRVKTGYAGTVSMSTNDGASPAGHASVVVPAAYTFTAADAGQHVFSARMYNARNDVTITVSGDGKASTSNSFSVLPAAVASVSVSPSSASVGSGGLATFSAQAYDQYGNPIAGATYAWALGTPSLGTIAVSPNNTANATVAATTTTAAAAAVSSAVNVTATYGGATVTGSANLTVNPA